MPIQSVSNDLLEKEMMRDSVLVSKDPPPFYWVMWYPLPSLLLYPKWNLSPISILNSDRKELKISWTEQNPLMSEFISRIEHYHKIYTKLPFVEMIFLSNSITFNALDKNSDIDLFVVTKEGRIWTARFFASLIFFFVGMKRSKNKISQKFCLSFFVAGEGMNLSQLADEGEVDDFMAYWTLHLSLLYEGYQWISQKFYQKNSWLAEYFLLDSLNQLVDLDHQIYTWKAIFSRFVEYLFSGILGDWFEKLLRSLWSRRISRGVAKNPSQYQGTLISDIVLKFHEQTRKQVFSDKLYSDNQ